MNQRAILFGLLLALEAAIQYTHIPLLADLTGLVALLVWVVALGSSDRTSRTVSLILVAVGSILFAVSGTPLLHAAVSFGESANVLLIMALVPLASLPINLGGYEEALWVVSRDVRKPVYLFAVAALLVYLLGPVLLTAAIVLVWTVLYPVAEMAVQDPDDFLVVSLPRAYDASLLWAPSSPAMATVLGLTTASWTSIFWPGFLVSMVLLPLAALMERRGALFRPSVREEAAGLSVALSAGPGVEPGVRAGGGRSVELRAGLSKAVAFRKAGGLVAGLASFILAIVLLQRAGLTVFQSMIPCIAVTLAVWGAILGKFRETSRAAAKYMSTKVPALSSQFLLMTTAGFIGTALEKWLAHGFPGLAGAVHLNRLAFTLVASLFVWVLALVGVHPLIGMTITNSLMAPFGSAFSPTYRTLALLLGTVLGFNISPVSATMLVTSGCVGKNTIEVGVKRQWKYVVVAWVVGAVLLSVL